MRVRLGVICSLRAGSVFPPKYQGSATGEVPFIKVSDMDLRENGSRIVSANNWLTKDQVNVLGLRPFPPGTVVFAKIGEALKANRFRQLTRPTIIDNNMMGASPDLDRVDARFFYYALARFDLSEIAQGTALPYLTQSALRDLELDLPPFDRQRAVAKMLGSLDDKIELNRRMNKTLEEICRALFKFWFVDFGPVRAKAEGRWRKDEILPGMPADMWDLWPNELEESEIGEIPKGWSLVTLGDAVSTLESGSRPTGGASESPDGGVPSIGAENVLGLGRYDYSKTKYVPYDFYVAMPRGKLLRGDVLLYKDGAQIGRHSYFDEGFPFGECCINEHVFILRTHSPFGQRFLYFWLDQSWIEDEIASRNSGSAQPGLNQPAVLGLPILKPTEQVVRAFDLRVAPLTKLIFRAELESRTLSQTRDALLPKLLSGEIRVPDHGGP